MPGHGRKFNFYGQYKSKRRAKREEHKVHGFIRPVKRGGKRRYLVLKKKGS